MLNFSNNYFTLALVETIRLFEYLEYFSIYKKLLNIMRTFILALLLRVPLSSFLCVSLVSLDTLLVDKLVSYRKRISLM